MRHRLPRNVRQEETVVGTQFRAVIVDDAKLRDYCLSRYIRAAGTRLAFSARGSV